MFYLFDVQGYPQIVWPHELRHYEDNCRLIGVYKDVHALIRDFEKEKLRAEQRFGRRGLSSPSTLLRRPGRRPSRT